LEVDELGMLDCWVWFINCSCLAFLNMSKIK